MQKENLVVIGSGPAGLTAALYAGRANLNPLLITGNELGGQVSITYEVENYPGFPDGTTGPEIVESMRKQAEKFGARTEINEVTQVDFTHGSPFKIKTHSDEYEAKAVIVCTGASPKRLGVPGEDEFIGRGVSFCATCDGFFFRNKELVVVGGGDSALEEGLFLTRFAKQVRVVHRRDTLRAGPTLQPPRADPRTRCPSSGTPSWRESRATARSKAWWSRTPKTGSDETLPTDGVFVYVGHRPNSTFLRANWRWTTTTIRHRPQVDATSVPRRLRRPARSGLAIPAGGDLRRAGQPGRHDGRALAGGQGLE